MTQRSVQSMRWEALFDDLEAQLSLQDSREFGFEVAERARAELARVELSRRLLAHAGRRLRVVTASGELGGVLGEVAPSWLLLAEGHPGAPADLGRQPGPSGHGALTPSAGVLVPTGAILRVDGLGRAVAAEPGRVLRSLSLGHALRALARDRVGVQVMTRGAVVNGTIDRVGADHFDLTLHPSGEFRRSSAVVGTATVPFAALDWVRTGS